MPQLGPKTIGTPLRTCPCRPDPGRRGWQACLRREGAANVSRLIDIQPLAQDLPADLTVGVGDLLRFAASGGHVREGAAVEIVGIFVESVLGTDGRVITPMGS